MLRIGYLHLRSITPTSLGTYSPEFSDKLFRITELRGQARWWPRAIVSDIVGFDKKIILEIQSKIFGGLDYPHYFSLGLLGLTLPSA